MNGYMMNTTPGWKHAMKRSIGPGAKVPLDELFEQYGVKHGLKEGKEFVDWLKTVKLKDNKAWKIVFNTDAEGPIPEEEVVKPTKHSNAPDNIAPMVPVKMTVEDVVGMSVRQARESLPRVTDLNLLKYAFQEANQLSGKDSLCKVIRKRIRDLNIAR